MQAVSATSTQFTVWNDKLFCVYIILLVKLTLVQLVYNQKRMMNYSKHNWEIFWFQYL